MAAASGAMRRYLAGAVRCRLTSVCERRFFSQLTAASYPSLRRGEYTSPTEDDIRVFTNIVGKGYIIGPDADPSEFDAFNTDWLGKYKGQSRTVLKPKSTQEVSEILKHCNSRNIAVCPQGGNTGLVGGSNPVFDEVVLCLGRMNQVRSFDAVSGAFVCGAGTILGVAEAYLADRGHTFPLDLGAKGSCQVGGNVSTNAGGIRLLRYGSLHGSVLGVEAVLADGTVINDLGTLRKNNTGYDLKQLFIGSEGTIGVVTGVSILCPQRPHAVNVALLGVSSFQQVLKTFSRAKSQLQEILSAFEFMDLKSQRLVKKHTSTRHPLEDEYPFYVLIETSGSNKDHDDAKLEAFLEGVMADGTVEDGTIAQDETQQKSIWAWREGIAEACNKCGGTYKYDVSIAQEHLYQLVDDTAARLAEGGVVGDTDDFPVVETVGYGHLGDGNLHLNVGVRRYDKKVEQLLEPFVYEWIQKHNGSISAEHGIGFCKKSYMEYARDEASLGVMRSMKRLFDPKGILNPYKVV
mmetsp:Transcript_33885/g.95217  ORF Transcript_33885/g.95217 Transcript_33885/m.95217 type:complete len:519 (+) Transcript_33885:77-1633(+)